MPRKGENIYKRKDGRWEGRYIKSRTQTGKATYGFVYAKTYRDVKTKLMEKISLKNEAATVISAEPEAKTELFENVAMEWLTSIKSQIKESTNNKYWNLLNSYILPKFGKKELLEITYDYVCEQCNQFLKTGGKKGTGLSAKTVSDILSLIRNILQFAVQKGIVITCDTHLIHVKHPTKEMRVLSRSEQEKLCRYLYSDLDSCNMGILLCLFTGLRVGEICALRWEDISFSEKTIHVHQTLQRIQDRTGGNSKTRIVITTAKSACSIRTIPIPDDLVELLALHKSSPSGYFLTNSEQKYLEPRTMQSHFKKALQKSEVDPANYHALRHTFATRCIELGFDVKSLSEILGHASVNITMNRYVHPSIELKKKNMQRLSALLAVK